MLADATSSLIAPAGPGPAVFVTGARLEPVTIAVVALGAAWYLRAVRRTRRQGGHWSTHRVAAFLYGEALVAVAVLSGLSVFARTNFTAYGAMYIMVGLAAPVLLAMGSPVALWRLGHPGRAGRAPGRLIRVLSNPLVAWPPFAASMFVLFYTGLLGATIHNSAVQQVTFAALIGVGFVFWWPVVALDPVGWRLGHWPRIAYLLLVFPVFAILGMTLESQSGGLVTGISPASLHLGGAVIWVAGETLALGGALAVFVQWLRADERAARRHDEVNEAAAARQLALWRASREAAARAMGS